MSSLATLERILAVGAHHISSYDHAKPKAEKRYDGQCDDLSLSPVSECSWESSDADVCLKPTVKRETLSSPDLTRGRPVLPLGYDKGPTHEQSFDVPASPTILRTSIDTLPSMLESSPPASVLGPNGQDEQPPTLPRLQAKGTDYVDGLNPVDGEDIDANNFDLLVPASNVTAYSLEHRSELLFSVEHLRVIFSDPVFLRRFTVFVHLYRPHSVPLLNYTLDALKAIRAMEYMNQIISESLRTETQQPQPQHPHGFSVSDAAPELTQNESLRKKTAVALEALARDELPAYVTSVWTNIVELSMRRRITGTMPVHLQSLSEGLAEVFCLTDPSRQDNPIVFASEGKSWSEFSFQSSRIRIRHHYGIVVDANTIFAEFHRTTQYGPDYVLGRNCRFLQGPKTNPFSVQRLREKIKQGKEHYETFLNYRRDGLPFMNLLMFTPLLDSMGTVRYFLGAQVDVSGLVKDCSGLESLRRLVDQDEREWQHEYDREDRDVTDRRNNSAETNGTAIGRQTAPAPTDPTCASVPEDGVRLLAEMFNRTELETVRRFGGRMLQSQQEQGPGWQHVEAGSNWHKPRVVLQDQYDLSPPLPPSQGLGLGGAGEDVGRQNVGRDISDANGNITLNMPSRPSSSPSPTLFSHGTSGSSLGGTDGAEGRRPPAIFENYLVVRPYPSMRILFASPSLRVPGTLQSHLMSRIGGSRRIHEDLEHAFATGQSVTAKIKWIPSTGLRNASTNSSANNANGNGGGGSGATLSDASSVSTGGAAAAAPSRETVGLEGRPRWIHCTPLMGVNGTVGVWVVVIVDDDCQAAEGGGSKRRRREASVPLYAGSTHAHSGSAVSSGVAGARQGSPSVRGVGATAGAATKSSRSVDDMSLSGNASLGRLPEDDELRRHVHDMYEEARLRERAPSSVREREREWERGWNTTPGDGDADGEVRLKNQDRANSMKSTGGGSGGGKGSIRDGSARIISDVSMRLGRKRSPDWSKKLPRRPDEAPAAAGTAGKFSLLG